MADSRSKQDPRAMRGSKILTWIPLLVLVALVLVMFGDVLVSPRRIVLSAQGQDAELFIPWREFGFGELRRGNLALWNPHILSGHPFFGGFQGALLYPPNAIYLILPLHRAFNLDFVLHVLLVGLFTYAWAAYRGVSPQARLVSAALVMFGAQFFFRIYAGHPTLMAVMAWTPLIFLACDGLARAPSIGWCLLGALGVAMQILAGSPQFFFCTGVVAVLYGVPMMLFSPQRVRALALGAATLLFGGALAAVQLLAGMQTANESVRGGQGLTYETAASVSMPPESLLTLLAPDFFGDVTQTPYWGRWYLWEVSLFMGATGFVLAVCGAWFGFQRDRRATLVTLCVIVLTLVLAAGAYTPLFRLLYNYAPGFSKFRAHARFAYPALVLLAMLAGYGLDSLMRFPQRARTVGIVVLTIAILIAAPAVWIYHLANTGPQSSWAALLKAVSQSGESFLPTATYVDPAFVQSSGVLAAKSLGIAAVTLLLLCIALFLFNRQPRVATYCIVALAVVEVMFWSWHKRATFDMAAIQPAPFEAFLHQRGGDERTLNPARSYNAMSLKAREIGGYDTCVPRRYAEFIAFTQASDPNQANAYLMFQGYHPLYRMLRCRYIILFKDNQWQLIDLRSVLPRVLLIQDVAVAKGRDQVFKALASETFDPSSKVILEQEPNPKPEKTADKGSVKMVDSSTDHLTVEADLPHPAILLITDSYSEGWRAVALPGSAQQSYQLLPANYVLRGIPMAAGKHRLRVEYSPAAYRTAAAISISAVVLYLGVLIWYMRFRMIYVAGSKQALTSLEK